MIHDEEHIRERMRYSFEEAASSFGVGLTLPELMSSLSCVTFGTALAWTLGMDEEEVQDEVRKAAEFVHRENPDQLKCFLDGWEAVRGE